MPTNFFPKDSTVPYPHAASNRTKKSTPQGTPTMAEMRKGSVAPVPTGRLVTMEEGSVGHTHWCPDAIKANVFEWTCPTCGQPFFWSIVDQCWKPSEVAA